MDDPRPNSPEDVGYIDQAERPPRPLHDPKTCRSCGAPIFWARKPDGKAFPVDAAPSDRGNVQLYDRGGTVVAKVLGNEAAKNVRDAAWALGGTHTLRLAHHVTCPNREQWGAKKRTEGAEP